MLTPALRAWVSPSLQRLPHTDVATMRFNPPVWAASLAYSIFDRTTTFCKSRIRRHISLACHPCQGSWSSGHPLGAPRGVAQPDGRRSGHTAKLKSALLGRALSVAGVIPPAPTRSTKPVAAFPSPLKSASPANALV